MWHESSAQERPCTFRMWPLRTRFCSGSRRLGTLTSLLTSSFICARGARRGLLGMLGLDEPHGGGAGCARIASSPLLQRSLLMHASRPGIRSCCSSVPASSLPRRSSPDKTSGLPRAGHPSFVRGGGSKGERLSEGEGRRARELVQEK
eukprot:scaffold192962_cov28-Tisochrysis_lutea.AAC.1